MLDGRGALTPYLSNSLERSDEVAGDWKRRRAFKAGGCPADDIVVTEEKDGRCPRCGAHVRADAPWCTLCYADLRPAPKPVAMAAASPASAAAEELAALAYDPLTAPLALVEAGGHGQVSGGTPTETAESAASEKVSGWPCTRCDTVVSFDESVCSSCGTGFLDGAAGEPDFVQRIGAGGISTGKQVMIIAGGTVGLVALLLIVLFIAGAIF